MLRAERPATTSVSPPSDAQLGSAGAGAHFIPLQLRSLRNLVQLCPEAVPSDHEDMSTGPAVKHMLSERHVCRQTGRSPLLRLGVHRSEC